MSKKEIQQVKPAAVGRPLRFETPEQLSQAIEAYFTLIAGEREPEFDEDDIFGEKPIGYKWIRLPEPATITGLALALGFADRQSLYDYGDRDEFSCIIKNARLRVEHEYEKKLSGNNVAGPIFALKNMSWKDIQENRNTNVNVDVPVSAEEVDQITKALKNSI